MNTDSLPLQQRFDSQHKKHFLNNHPIVMHCHHYGALYTQLALDAKETTLLAEVSEDAFFTILNDYFSHIIYKQTISQRIEIAREYFSAFGLGKMQVNYLGDYSGEIELLTSHIDQGWIKKWGHHDEPVNYIVAGYCSALFSSILNQPVRAFKTTEIKSIVMGAETSLFKVERA
jgi:hypothetical protein